MTGLYLFPEIAEPKESLYGFQLKAGCQPPPTNKSKLEKFVNHPTADDYLLKVFAKYPEVRDNLQKLLEAEGAFDNLFSGESK